MSGSWGSRPSGVKHWSPDARSDEPSARVVHPPTAEGIGTGRAFFFLFGYRRASERDQGMLARELAEIEDDVAVLRDAGYTVVVDRQATREEFVATVTGKGEGAEGLTPAGFYWSGHGLPDGSLECCDGGTIAPADLDPASVAPGLRLAVLGACYVGARSRTWRAALGGAPLVVGWGRPVTIDRAVDFLAPDAGTSADLDDLIRRWLLVDAPLPPDVPPAGLADPARDGGRVGQLAERVGTVALMLHATYRTVQNRLGLIVPLPEGRDHYVELFLVDAAEPFMEGALLAGVEADVGETSAVVTPELLLSASAAPGYGRVALVRSTLDSPRIVVQSFLPYARATDQELAAHLYAVAARADALENTLFGGDDG